MALRQGSIIWVQVNDPAGRNPKCRPAVVITPTEEIKPGEVLVAVAATSTIPNPLPDRVVELPWHANRHPLTGLYKRCIAVCDWLIEFSQEDVQKVGGFVPSATLLKILARLPKP